MDLFSLFFGGWDFRMCAVGPGTHRKKDKGTHARWWGPGVCALMVLLGKQTGKQQKIKIQEQGSLDCSSLFWFFFPTLPCVHPPYTLLMRS